MSLDPAPPSQDLAFAPITELSALLDHRETTPEALVELMLGRIKRCNGSINAFLETRADAARQDAALAGERIRSGRRLGPLDGIPIAVKDLFRTPERATTFGSPHFRRGAAGAPAATIERLRTAGAIIIGYTNLDEFAFGSFNANRISAKCGTPGMSRGTRAAPAADRPRPSLPAWPPAPSARIPACRSASRRPCAISSG